MQQHQTTWLPWIATAVVSAGFVIVACSSSDPVFPAATAGAGGADAAAGGASQGGASQGGAGGSSAGSGGVASGGQAGSSTGGMAGTSNGGSAGKSTGGSAGSSTGGSAGSSTGGSAGASTGGSGGKSTGGSAGSSIGGSGGTSTGGSAGTGGSTVDAGLCAGQPVSIATIASNTLPDNTLVSVTGAIATSPKFQVTNSCLWGVFVKGSGSNAGTFVISQGVASGTICTPGTDQLPQGLVPGDIIDFGARLIHFTAAGCTGVPALVEVQISASDGCTATKTGNGLAPAPIDVAAGDLLGGIQYPNQLVRVTNVTLQDLPDGGVVDKQGTILLQGSGLAVRDSIYWRTQGAPQFTSSQFFNSIVGINSQPMIVNGICSYTLLPRDKCMDYVPKSMDCP